MINHIQFLVKQRFIEEYIIYYLLLFMDILFIFVIHVVQSIFEKSGVMQSFTLFYVTFPSFYTDMDIIQRIGSPE